MKIHDALLKLIEENELMGSDELNLLRKDTKEWDKENHSEATLPIHKLYYKIHEHAPVRLLMVFFYVYLTKWYNDMTSPIDDRSVHPFERD